jgi:hypothetical protein
MTPLEEALVARALEELEARYLEHGGESFDRVFEAAGLDSEVMKHLIAAHVLLYVLPVIDASGLLADEIETEERFEAALICAMVHGVALGLQLSRVAGGG